MKLLSCDFVEVSNADIAGPDANEYTEVLRVDLEYANIDEYTYTRSLFGVSKINCASNLGFIEVWSLLMNATIYRTGPGNLCKG